MKEVNDEKNRYHDGITRVKEFLSAENGGFPYSVMKNRERVRPKTLWMRKYSHRKGK